MAWKIVIAVYILSWLSFVFGAHAAKYEDEPRRTSKEKIKRITFPTFFPRRLAAKIFNVHRIPLN